MSWLQSLVNAQTEINRVVFEMNKPGRNPPKKPNKEYIKKHTKDAIDDLKKALEGLK